MDTETRMKCLICGHIYDPKKGEQDIPVGTAFVALPDDWCCPVCGAAKKQFTEVK
ncbi:rubredoxin [Methanogenium sp. S4BF]|uniref:rubredoxin n=1 Tax=Methanogenium sp. S4BF TaxID=1789226 RepID=UPI002415EFB4|nr:rubredoxin [Methanogenium sp. S4BF]WFN33745.1 rubredoxin [Methanogenium sp. S4BF]